MALLLERWQQSQRTRALYEVEHRLRRHDGVYRWVLARAVPILDGQGRIVRWFGTLTDIAEIVEAREVLARGRAELERLVAERTRDLEETQARLAHARRIEAFLTAARCRRAARAAVAGRIGVMQRKGEPLSSFEPVERAVAPHRNLVLAHATDENGWVAVQASYQGQVLHRCLSRAISVTQTARKRRQLLRMIYERLSTEGAQLRPVERSYTKAPWKVRVGC